MNEIITKLEVDKAGMTYDFCCLPVVLSHIMHHLINPSTNFKLLATINSAVEIASS